MVLPNAVLIIIEVKNQYAGNKETPIAYFIELLNTGSLNLLTILLVIKRGIILGTDKITAIYLEILFLFFLLESFFVFISSADFNWKKSIFVVILLIHSFCWIYFSEFWGIHKQSLILNWRASRIRFIFSASLFFCSVYFDMSKGFPYTKCREDLAVWCP